MTACARHGFFAPGSGVDFKKGERQLNIDWSFCEAMRLTGTDQAPWTMHIYDVECQYWKNFRVRVATNKYLDLDPATPLKHAVGLFHVHGHQENCLYEYATTFIKGAGVLDGEILESLWSPLNTVFKSMRTASLSHRAEVFDDHKGDSNWKKMTGIGACIISWCLILCLTHLKSHQYVKGFPEQSERKGNFGSTLRP